MWTGGRLLDIPRECWGGRASPLKKKIGARLQLVSQRVVHILHAGVDDDDFAACMVRPTGGILLATCDDTGPGGISQPASMYRQSARRRGLDAGGVLHAQGMRQTWPTSSRHWETCMQKWNKPAACRYLDEGFAQKWRIPVSNTSVVQYVPLRHASCSGLLFVLEENGMRWDLPVIRRRCTRGRREPVFKISMAVSLHFTFQSAQGCSGEIENPFCSW